MKKHPSNVELIREAVDLMYGPGGAPKELKGPGSESAVRKFYERYKEMLAGPIQSAVMKHYDIGDSTVVVPKRIQKLFMDVDTILAEKEAKKTEWEDKMMREAGFSSSRSKEG